MKANFKKFGAWVLAVVLCTGMSTMFVSCGDDDDDNNNNPPAGPTDPSTIAASNLVAYFNFEGNGNSTIGALVPAKEQQATYPTGRRGKAYQGTGTADIASYLMYNLPSDSKLKTLKAFTTSMWLKMAPTADGGPEPMVYQIDGLWGDMGNFALKQQRNPVPYDTAQFQVFFFSEGYDYQGQFISDIHSPGYKLNTWIHVIFTYDNVSSKFYAYLNGDVVKLPDSSTNRYQKEGGPALGDMKFADANHFVIGSWYAKAAATASAQDWMGYYKGLLDELRIYDRALTAAEAKQLYTAEAENIND